MVRKKVKSKNGFTLTELLVTVVILSLFSALLVTGVSLAMRSYPAITDESNAQVLVSTCASMLRNELSNAREVSLSGEGVLSYKKGDSDSISTLRVSGGQIMLGESGKEKPFVSDVTATNDLCPCYESIEYADSEFKIHNLTVKKKDGDRVLASINLLVISNR